MKLSEKIKNDIFYLEAYEHLNIENYLEKIQKLENELEKYKKIENKQWEKPDLDTIKYDSFLYKKCEYCGFKETFSSRKVLTNENSIAKVKNGYTFRYVIGWGCWEANKTYWKSGKNPNELKCIRGNRYE
jgi:hypothetical protein